MEKPRQEIQVTSSPHPQHPSYRMKKSFIDELFEQLKKHGDKVAQVDSATGYCLSFSEVLRGSEALAASLRSRGLRPGHVALVIGENRAHYTWALLGVLRAGAAAHLINPRSNSGELEHALSLTNAHTALLSEEVSRNTEVTAALCKATSVRHVLVWGAGGAGGPGHVDQLHAQEQQHGPAAVQKSLLAVDGNPDTAVAVILHSSGTTGLPKGVMLTYGNLRATVSLGPHFMRSDDVVAGLLPNFHCYGFGLMLMALRLGARIVSVKQFSGVSDLLYGTMVRHGVTAVYVVPSLLLSLAAHQDFNATRIPTLRFIMSGGGTSVSREVQLDLLHRFPGLRMIHGYGMTECSFAIMYALMKDGRKPDNCGKALGDMKIKVIDQESGQEVLPGHRGEICVRGSMVMKGYVANPEATRLTIEEDGWLHTGDLAYVDEDGDTIIVDRIKFIFKFNGHQVSPSEVELFLCKHPGVREAAVMGVPHRYGDAPLALVVRAEGAPQVSEEELKQFIAERLEPHKALSGGVRFVDALPKTASGKLQRALLPGLLRTCTMPSATF